jgi:hypothetical protein
MLVVILLTLFYPIQTVALKVINSMDIKPASGNIACCSGTIYTVAAGQTACCTDDDCSGYDPTTHLKLICDTSTHTCKSLLSCSKDEDCADNWCCTADSLLPAGCRDLVGSCVEKGSRRCDNKYLCDPPEGFVSLSEERNKPLTLFDFLINFFLIFFHKVNFNLWS